MGARKLGWLMALVFGTVLMTAGDGYAGPLLGWHKADCPRPSYSPFHYWTPSLYRANAYFHGPHLGMYAPNREPGIPPRYQINSYPCPAVDPATLYRARELTVTGSSARQGP
jgi:hypothetical protein